MQKDAPMSDLGELAAAGEAPPKLQAFAPAELIACDTCGRANAPNRGACIYCGASLVSPAEQSPAGSVPKLQADASPDSGVILVTTETTDIADDQAEKLGALLQVESRVLRSCLGAGGPLPLLRPATAEEVVKLSADLLSAGLETFSISDQELGLVKQFKKIRSLEFRDDSIAALPKSESGSAVSLADVLLVVKGRLITNRVEIEEKRRRRSATPVDSRQFVADESVMDIYHRLQAVPWRIYANAFDFSCLGPAKTMTGFENFAALVNLIRERMPNVVIDDSYHRKRAVLETVWPLERKDQSELRLAGRGKLNVSNITTSDNEAQFNKYSALAWHIRAKEWEDAQ